VLAAVFSALTLRPATAMLLTAILGASYSFAAWVSPSEGFLYAGIDRIKSVMLGGRQMKADEVTSLAINCGFLFVGAWIAMRISAGWRQKVSRLEVHATRDPLTGLPNRRAFVEKVRGEIDRAERYRWPLTLLIIDLDHFKRVNDQHGHGFGDAVLGQASQLLREAVGTIDHLARIGGEEFSVAAVGADPNHGGDLAARVLRRFRTFEWERMKAGLKVTCSIGVAVLYPQQPGDADGKLSWLLEEADKALYHVKENGRDNFSVANPTGNASRPHTRSTTH
jgi:diguanylate cyclase (GGDEF)-like protein